MTSKIICPRASKERPQLDHMRAISLEAKNQLKRKSKTETKKLQMKYKTEKIKCQTRIKLNITKR